MTTPESMQSSPSGTHGYRSRTWHQRPQIAFPFTVLSMLATLGTKSDFIAIISFISAGYWAWAFADSLLRAIADSGSQRPPV